MALEVFDKLAILPAVLTLPLLHLEKFVLRDLAKVHQPSCGLLAPVILGDLSGISLPHFLKRGVELATVAQFINDFLVQRLG